MLSTSLIRALLGTVIVIIFCYSDPALAQRCNLKGKITSFADVYEGLPRYVTGVGWQGVRTTTLPPGTQIYVCAERTAQFGFFQKKWSNIAYYHFSNWKYGWILSENWINWTSMNGDPRTRGFAELALIATAFAAEMPSSEGVGEKWTIPEEPPDFPPGAETDNLSSEESKSAIPWSDLIDLYGPRFIAMLIGMIAKTFVDYLDAWERTTLWVHLRNGVTSVLVSPIVFLGFLSAGQFETSRQTFIVLSLLAFQNGFFWQTVLGKDRSARPSAP